MSQQQSGQPEPSLGRRVGDAVRRRYERRRQRMKDEIQRNRQGGHTVPTWVLWAILVLIVVGWLVLIFTVPD